ncbi:MAG: LysR family transcriptional regulator [Coriobacteriales bacterium]
MDIAQVDQFVRVARRESVSAAAKELHVSQPALSRSLRRMESELGCSLFDRTKNSLVLNDAGRAALPHAEELLRSERRMRDAIAESLQHGRMLRVGAIAPAPLWYLTSLVVDALPGTLLAPEMFESEDSLERDFLSGRLDAALTTRPIPGSESALCMHEDLFLWAPDDHPLARREEVSCADFAGETFLVYGQIGFWWHLHERLMPHSMLIRQNDREVWSSLMATSRALGFTTNASVTIRSARRHGTPDPVRRVAVPISDEDLHVDFHLCVRAGAQETCDQPDTLEKRVLALVREHPWIPDDGDVPGV